MSQKEAFSRIIIDRKLREAGWNIEDESQVVFEDHGTAGRADYVLKDSKGRPIAVIEAKAPNIDPYTAKKQARDYRHHTLKLDQNLQLGYAGTDNQTNIKKKSNCAKTLSSADTTATC